MTPPFKRGQLLYFVTVADEGQMTRAARKLHMAQPALSQAISQLESEVGVKLLVRHARGVSLTSAGDAFLPKARAAVASEQDASATAQSLARAAHGSLEIGFIGPPPTINAPELFACFAETYPGAEIAYRDLPFPLGSTGSWLQDVDIAYCHAPEADTGVSMQRVRREPRAIMMPAAHPLARRSELLVEEVLDEMYVSYHPRVQSAWAGFHSLDDHRGAPPARLTPDGALTSLQMLGIMSSGRAVTVVPLPDATLAQSVLAEVAAIPLADAAPAELSLIWRAEARNPLLDALVAMARSLPGASPDGGAAPS